MWRRFFKPEVLFLTGTIQAIYPYVTWYLHGPNLSYDYTITYIPLVIWVLGYAGFWLGAKLAGIGRKGKIVVLPPSELVRHPRRYRILLAIVLVALLAQLVGLFFVYGGIPLLSFLSEEMVTEEADQAIVANAALGQMGLFLQTLFVLNALIVVLLISGSNLKRRHVVLLFVALLAEVIAGMHAGKRQTVFISALFIACASSLALAHPVRPLLAYIRLPAKKFLARAILIIVPLMMVAFMGWMTRVRSRTEITGSEQVAVYIQIALINLETQARWVGYGPMEMKPQRLLTYLLPHRIVFMNGSNLFEGYPAPRAEPSATAGFYGDLHWNVGLGGCILFAFFVGWLTKYIYIRAFRSLFHLLVYSQVAWTLIAAHSYNHFLHVNFLIVPAVAFWLMTRLNGRRPRVRRLAPPNAPSIAPAALVPVRRSPPKHAIRSR